GLLITPKQVLQNGSILELAGVTQSSGTEAAEDEPSDGIIPLTPIQHWFFEQHLPDPHHYNQAVMFGLKQPLNADLLEKTLEQLIEHHHALRLRFERVGRDWKQSIAARETHQVFKCVNLSSLTPEAQTAEINRVADETQSNFDLSNGPIIRAVYFDLGAARPRRLLIVIHHLAIDGVSWRILLDDLQRAYEQLSDGQPVMLPAKTTSFRHWADRLQNYAQSEEVRRELAYWLDVQRAQVARLPVDGAHGEQIMASSQSLAVSLSSVETQALLHEVPLVYHTQINDVLLTALTQALVRWTGEQRILINLEGHGREELFPDVDLSRTIGWFTSLFPVVLDLGAQADAGMALKAIKEQLRRIPNRGIGYGLLRYLSTDQATIEQLRALPEPEISFNYLGQFDQALSEAGLFGPAPESSGPPVSPRSRRPYLLDINGSISGGQLHLVWSFSQNSYEQATIEKLAGDVLDALRALIAHCQMPEAGGYTPSDFPLVQLTQEQIDVLLGADRQIETIYPLTPLQQGLLFHTL